MTSSDFLYDVVKESVMVMMRVRGVVMIMLGNLGGSGIFFPLDFRIPVWAFREWFASGSAHFCSMWCTGRRGFG